MISATISLSDDRSEPPLCDIEVNEQIPIRPGDLLMIDAWEAEGAPVVTIKVMEVAHRIYGANCHDLHLFVRRI